MSAEAPSGELVGRHADDRLLQLTSSELPPDLTRSPALSADPRRAAVVGAGATLTGVTLVAGIALAILGAVELIAGSSGFGLPALVAGVALMATHWGWVHVAELTANRLQAGHDRQPLADQRTWLAAIEPYARHSVSTYAEPDGTIVIERVAYRPVPLGPDRFTFVREVEGRESHAPDEPGAAVAERAELLRRAAAQQTEHGRSAHDAAIAELRNCEIRADDDTERDAAARAASQALSDQINRNLARPPLE